MSEGYGERWAVVVSQSNQFSSPMGSILHGERGRSWAPSDTPNTSGVEPKHEQNRICLEIQLPNELGKQEGGKI